MGWASWDDFFGPFVSHKNSVSAAVVVVFVDDAAAAVVFDVVGLWPMDVAIVVVATAVVAVSVVVGVVVTLLLAHVVDVR
jgi:hypothetical protein